MFFTENCPTAKNPRVIGNTLTSMTSHTTIRKIDFHLILVLYIYICCIGAIYAVLVLYIEIYIYTYAVFVIYIHICGGLVPAPIQAVSNNSRKTKQNNSPP